MKPTASFLLVMLCAAMLSSQTSPREQVGKQPDGSFLLATGWRIKPAGAQIPLDTLPMSSAISPDGKFLLVLNGGYKPPSISVLSVTPVREISRVPVADGWLGLAFSPNGRMVYVGGGSRNRVFEYTFSSTGELKPSREFELNPGTPITPQNFVGDVAVSPDGRLIYAADLFHDSIVVINPQSGMVIERFKTGRRPYRILFHPDGKTFFVSSWSDGTVYQHSWSNGEELGRIRLGPHTTDMVLSDRKIPDQDDPPRYRLFVSAANTNSVFVVGLNESKTMKMIETINIALTPRHPLGMTPSAVALSPDQTNLLVTCSDANTVAVADISEERSRVTGFLPVGWYPTAARVLPDGHVLVLNGRGLGSYPNTGYDGPKPASNVHAGDEQAKVRCDHADGHHVSDRSVNRGSTRLSTLKTTQSLSRFKDSDLDLSNLPGDSVIYTRPGKPSPIEHVIYIVKENRTYDQVFSKIGKGNSDPSLTLFDESAAPNHYKLAREFVLFDNFYVNADVSADGHNWAIAGIAPDYVQKLWQNSYAQRLKSGNSGYEGAEPANSPPTGYLWGNALSAGLSVRNYGYWVENKKTAGPDGVQIEKVYDPVLRSPVVDMRYRSFDLDYPDVERARVFLEDLKQFETSGTMPRLMLVRLGNDHTNGTTAGKLAPLSSFADNDYALGMLVEGVSKSRFWSKTAIFVIEDDAQNGPDHVDSHRSPVLVLSPYTRRGIVDSSMYNQSSVLRTMELILGMRPLTHFDAGARPMTEAFASTPDATPYTAEKPRISLTSRNPARSTTAARSARMNFDDADEIDDDELNDILWTAIKGTEPPAPVRSYFSRQ